MSNVRSGSPLPRKTASRPVFLIVSAMEEGDAVPSTVTTCFARFASTRLTPVFSSLSDCNQAVCPLYATNHQVGIDCWIHRGHRTRRSVVQKRASGTVVSCLPMRFGHRLL